MENAQSYRWYVYQLIDPRDQSVFYIGKGTGSRIHAHEKEASKGVCSNKCNKIKEIWEEGLSIVKRIICYCNDEKYAYQVESAWIRSTPNLTNWGAIVNVNSAIYPVAVVQVQAHYDAMIERIEYFAYWFKHSEGGKNKVDFALSQTGTMARVVTAMVRALYDSIFPKSLKAIQSSPVHANMLRSELSKFGITYGC